MNEFFRISNDSISVTLCSVGAAITSFVAKDKFGCDCEMLLSFQDKKGYDSNGNYFGSTIGRVANRLKNAEFELDGTVYKLDKNDGENCLHGGHSGFSTKNFSVAEKGADFIEFCYKSPHLEGGFPGTMEARVRYSLEQQSGLLMEFSATSDKDTPCNMTNHAYFTLGGTKLPESIYDYVVKIDSDEILELDSTLCVTGNRIKVAGTAYDFNFDATIGSKIVNLKDGYDTCYCLNNNNQFQKVASVHNPENGITLELHTDCTGLQFYSGNFLKDEFSCRSAFCLEAQRLIGNVNGFILKAGQMYQAKKMYKVITSK